jgi:hypothetical protein
MSFGPIYSVKAPTGVCLPLMLHSGP